MKAFTQKKKTAATIAVSLAALTGGALTHEASAREASANDLRVHVTQLGDVPGFWSADCPIVLENTAAWAPGDGPEAAALRGEGFAIGVRELLRSTSGDFGVSVALRFHSPAGAKADLSRRERLAGHATTFPVPGSSAVHASTARSGGSTTVRVAFTRGTDEYAVAVEAAKDTNLGALQRALVTAVSRVAGAR